MRTLILIGPVITLLQNIIYALPARSCFILAGAVIQVSLDGTTFANLVGSNVGIQTSAIFVRCATGDTSFVAKV